MLSKAVCPGPVWCNRSSASSLLRCRCQTLAHLFLDIFGVSFDLYVPIAQPRLVARLRKDRRTVAHLAGAQVEARFVPGTDDGVAFAISIGKRSPEVSAGVGNGTDLAVLPPAEQDLDS